jgi:hypothetical protein
VTTDTLACWPRWCDGEHRSSTRQSGRVSQVFVVDRKPDSTWSAPRRLSDDVGAGANWSSDGRWIAFADPDGHIRVVSPEGGKGRVIAGPETVNGQRFRRPLWLVGEPVLLARAEAPGGQGGIWRYRSTVGAPRAGGSTTPRDRSIATTSPAMASGSSSPSRSCQQSWSLPYL